MTLLELVNAITKANREEMYRLAKEHPEYRCSYRGTFIDMVHWAQAESLQPGIDGGVLGDNMASIDQIINLGGAWRRASRRAWKEEEEKGKNNV